MKAIRFIDKPCFIDKDDVEDTIFLRMFGLPASCDRFEVICVFRKSGNGVCEGLDVCVQPFVT